MITSTLRNSLLLCCVLAANSNAQLGKAFDYFPLQVGNIWEFDATFRQLRNDIVSDTTAPNGIRYYKMFITSPNAPGTRAFSYYHYNADSTKVYQVGAQIGNEEWLFMDVSKGINQPWFDHKDTTSSASMQAISDTGQTELFGKTWETITIQPVRIENDSLIYNDDAYLSYAKGLGEIVSGGGTWLVYARIAGLEYGTPLTSVDDDQGFVYKPDDSQLDIFPNPFNNHASLTVRAQDRENAQITVFNLLGQRVRVLFQGELFGGVQNHLWDGKDDRGREVPQGSYFIRLKTPRNVVNRFVTLIR